jgi:hypothetical protein
MDYNPDTYCWYAFSAYDSNHKYFCCMNRGDYQNWTQLNQSPKILEIRESLKNGHRHPDCGLCWNNESLGAISTRQHSLQWIERSMPQKNYYDPRLRAIWLDTGTTCNLSCRTCSANWSSSLVREFRDRWPESDPPPIQHTDLDYLLNEDFSDLTSVIVIGGEPFLNLKYVRVLEKMIEQGHSKKIKVTCFTNGTHPIPNRILAVAPHFETFNILVSIDGTDEEFEYIRTGSSWGPVTTNIQEFFKLAEQNNILVMFTIVISALNVLSIPNIYDYFLSCFRIFDTSSPGTLLTGEDLYKEVLRRGWMVSNVLTHPDHYGFGVFNEQQKQVIRERLVHPYYDFSPVLSALDRTPHDPELTQKFWREAEWTNSYYSLDIREHLPKIVALLES